MEADKRALMQQECTFATALHSGQFYLTAIVQTTPALRARLKTTDLTLPQMPVSSISVILIRLAR